MNIYGKILVLKKFESIVFVLVEKDKCDNYNISESQGK
jgi:hypothetical protein